MNDGKPPTVSLVSISPGGDLKLNGVVATEDSFDEDPPAVKPGGWSRCCAASSAASLIETAESFLFVVLNLNLLFGAYLARAASRFSESALTACS